MKKIFFFIIATLSIAASIFFLLTGEKVQVFQPKGVIAKKELDLIFTNVWLMLSILVPTFICLLIVIGKYKASNAKASHEPNKTYGKLNQVILWLIPSVIIFIMAIHTWNKTHELDPYKRLGSKDEELLIQVVALDWKWLFIYPEQAIATLNFVQFPEKRPIRFELVADGSPMNSFWIPQLSGQIYCMTGMVTPLHIIANGIGTYPGKAAEINGKGYAKMTFMARSSTEQEFQDWVQTVKQSPLALDHKLYAKLVTPSIGHPIQFFSNVDKDLFETIVHKVY